MTNGETAASRFLVPLTSAVVGGLIVSIVTTWLAAESSRAEAQRQERLTAYADFSGVLSNCFGFFLKADQTGVDFRDCDKGIRVANEKVVLVAKHQAIIVMSRDVYEAAVAFAEAAREAAADPSKVEARDQVFEVYHRRFSDLTLLERSELSESSFPPSVVLIVLLVVLSVVLVSLYVWLRRGVTVAGE